MIEHCYSIGQMCRELDTTRSRINFIIDKYHIKPFMTFDKLRVFDEDAFQRISDINDQIVERKRMRHGKQG